jgi:hypothetical protein
MWKSSRGMSRYGESLLPKDNPQAAPPTLGEPAQITSLSGDGWRSNAPVKYPYDGKLPRSRCVEELPRSLDRYGEPGQATTRRTSSCSQDSALKIATRAVLADFGRLRRGEFAQAGVEVDGWSMPTSINDVDTLRAV